MAMAIVDTVKNSLAYCFSMEILLALANTITGQHEDESPSAAIKLRNCRTQINTFVCLIINKKRKHAWKYLHKLLALT